MSRNGCGVGTKQLSEGLIIKKKSYAKIKFAQLLKLLDFHMHNIFFKGRKTLFQISKTGIESHKWNGSLTTVVLTFMISFSMLWVCGTVASCQHTEFGRRCSPLCFGTKPLKVMSRQSVVWAGGLRTEIYSKVESANSSLLIGSSGVYSTNLGQNLVNYQLNHIQTWMLCAPMCLRLLWLYFLTFFQLKFLTV